MRRHELERLLAGLEGFSDPDPSLEQVATPPEAAVELLAEALARGDLAGRTVADLGSGTGLLALGAALWGAASVRGIERDPRAVACSRRNAARCGVAFEPVVGEVAAFGGTVDTVVMNPPFGAQHRGADRPFWETAARSAAGAIYAFALTDSRTFIARWAVRALRPIAATRPIRWTLPATFPHHVRKRMELAVDLWVLGPARIP